MTFLIAKYFFKNLKLDYEYLSNGFESSSTVIITHSVDHLT